MGKTLFIVICHWFIIAPSHICHAGLGLRFTFRLPRGISHPYIDIVRVVYGFEVGVGWRVWLVCVGLLAHDLRVERDVVVVLQDVHVGHGDGWGVRSGRRGG